MASADRLLVSTFCHVLLLPSVSQPSKMNMHIALQKENGVSSLTIIESKRTTYNDLQWEKQ